MIFDDPLPEPSLLRDAVRAARAKESRPYTVLVRGGVYRLRAPIVFTPEDSGAPNAPIVYRGAAGTEVRLIGGRVIGGWEPVSDPDTLARVGARKQRWWYPRPPGQL